MLHTINPAADNQCRICNVTDCDHVVVTRWFDGFSHLQALSPVCGNQQCIDDIKFLMHGIIASPPSTIDSSTIQFTVIDNNDDPF